MRYMTALLGLVGVAAGSSLHRDSSLPTLNKIRDDIRAHVVLQGDNVSLFNGSVERLAEAEIESERKTRGINARLKLIANRNKSSIGLGGPKYPVIPLAIREEVKQDLLRVSKSGTRRPSLVGLEEIVVKANQMEALRNEKRQRQIRTERRSAKVEPVKTRSAVDRVEESLKAEKDADAQAARVAKRANKSLKTQVDMAKKEVADAKVKIADERAALEKKLAHKFDEESAVTIEELEHEVHDLVFKRNQDALKNHYRKAFPVLVDMERGVMTAESLKDFMRFIIRRMFMSAENVVLVDKNWIKLHMAEEAAQEAHREYLVQKYMQGVKIDRKFESGIVSETIRAEIKAALVKIYNESSFRPIRGELINEEALEDETPAGLTPWALRYTYEHRNDAEMDTWEAEQVERRIAREAAARRKV